MGSLDGSGELEGGEEVAGAPSVKAGSLRGEGYLPAAPFCHGTQVVNGREGGKIQQRHSNALRETHPGSQAEGPEEL